MSERTKFPFPLAEADAKTEGASADLLFELLLDDGNLSTGPLPASPLDLDSLLDLSAPLGLDASLDLNAPLAAEPQADLAPDPNLLPDPAFSPLPEKQGAMSVDDFKRLIQELYLEPDAVNGNLPLHNLAVLVDVSGSMEGHDPHLGLLRAALVQFFDKLAAYGGQGMPLNVCLVAFSDRVTARCSRPAFAAFEHELSDPLYAAIQGLAARGGTNYEAAFAAAKNWLREHSHEGSVDTVYFVTDGKPTCYYHDSFVHLVPASKEGIFIYNGIEFNYNGKGRIYFDEAGRVVSSNSNVRKYRAFEEGVFEVRVGSSLNWSAVRVDFVPKTAARRVQCALPPDYASGAALYYDREGLCLPGPRNAAYRVSSSGNFEQYRKGAWYTPNGTVLASAFGADGLVHSSSSTKVLGGSGKQSGDAEASIAVRACRDLAGSVGGLSLFALGIGSAVDMNFFSLFDSVAQAQVLSDVGQLSAALTGLADERLGLDLVTSAPVPEVPQDELFVDGAHMPVELAADADLPEMAAVPHVPSELLPEFADEVFDSQAAAFMSGTLPGNWSLAAPEDSVSVLRNFNLGEDRLDLNTLLSEHENVDTLLSRITAVQETRMVDGVPVSDLVLQIHADANADAPVVRTIVLEEFSRVDPDAPNDTHFLLQQLLYG